MGSKGVFLGSANPLSGKAILSASRITSPESNSLSSQTFRKLQADCVETALVQQCHLLQEPYDSWSDFAFRILQAQGCIDELSSF